TSLLAFTCLVGTGVSDAWAGDKTVVIVVTGPDDSRVFRYARDAMEDEKFQVIEMDEVVAFIDKNTIDIGSNNGRRDIAAEFDATAVIIIDVTDGRKYNLAINTFNGNDGSKLGEGKIRERKKNLKKTMRRQFFRQVKGDIKKSSTPSGASAQVDDTSDDTAAADDTADPDDTEDSEDPDDSDD